uniref:Protein phosphatase inhibitor 2 n=1 Tax=Steinernema glaseri TaxID=37863 RepID=A0A1I7Z6P6_9BILA
KDMEEWRCGYFIQNEYSEMPKDLQLAVETDEEDSDIDSDDVKDTQSGA